MKKKILSVVCALALIVGLSPISKTTAFADDPTYIVSKLDQTKFGFAQIAGKYQLSTDKTNWSDSLDSVAAGADVYVKLTDLDAEHFDYKDADGKLLGGAYYTATTQGATEQKIDITAGSDAGDADANIFKFTLPAVSALTDVTNFVVNPGFKPKDGTYQAQYIGFDHVIFGWDGTEDNKQYVPGQKQPLTLKNTGTLAFTINADGDAQGDSTYFEGIGDGGLTIQPNQELTFNICAPDGLWGSSTSGGYSIGTSTWPYDLTRAGAGTGPAYEYYYGLHDSTSPDDHSDTIGGQYDETSDIVSIDLAATSNGTIVAKHPCSKMVYETGHFGFDDIESENEELDDWYPATNNYTLTPASGYMLSKLELKYKTSTTNDDDPDDTPATISDILTKDVTADVTTDAQTGVGKYHFNPSKFITDIEDDDNIPEGKRVTIDEGTPIQFVATFVEIPKIDITDRATVTFTNGTSYTCTGMPLKPAVSVVYDDNQTTLRQGTDYTVAYTNNVEPGTATVTVKGKGAYSGTVTANFTIAGTAPAPVEPETPVMPSTPDPYTPEQKTEITNEIANVVSGESSLDDASEQTKEFVNNYVLPYQQGTIQQEEIPEWAQEIMKDAGIIENIVVPEPAPVIPGEDDNNGGAAINPADGGGAGVLPSTGDTTSIVAAASMFMLGLFACVALIRRRNNN